MLHRTRHQPHGRAFARLRKLPVLSLIALAAIGLALMPVHGGEGQNKSDRKASDQTKAPAKAGEASETYAGGYRGAQRTGVYPARDLVDKWPKDGPKRLWSYDKLARGWSSITVWQGKAYLLGGTNPGTMYCFRVEDGKLLFAKGYGPDRREGRFPAARSTIEIHDAKAYFATGDGVIHCLDATDGKSIWAVDTVKAFNNKVPGHGYNVTPLIHDGKLITSIRRGKHTHVALDLDTGKVIWANEPSTLAIGDSSPVLVADDKQPLVVDNLWHALVALDPKTGKIVWQHKEGRTGTMMTPVVHGRYVFADLGGHRAALFERTHEDEAPFRKVWKLDHGLSDISQSLILDGKVFYIASDRREVEREVTDKKGNTTVEKTRERYIALFARDLKTGKVLANHDVRASGSIAAADGKIFLAIGGEKNWNRGGKGIEAQLLLIHPTDDGFKVVGEFKPDAGSKEVWINPAIADGRLFFRQDPVLVCYDLRPDSYK